MDFIQNIASSIIGSLNSLNNLNSSDVAINLSNQWKIRADIIKKDILHLLNKKEKNIENLINLNESELLNEELNDLPNLYQMKQEIDDILIQIGEFPLSLSDVEKFCKYEMEIYKRIMTEEIRNKIVDEIKKEKEEEEILIEKIDIMFENVNRMWDEGKTEENIKLYIFENLIKIYPIFNTNQIKYLTENLFNAMTSEKKVRINLTEEEIKKLKRRKIEKETTCGTCLEEFNKDEEVLNLPCNETHSFHPDCIIPWLKMSVNCPTCRSDLRDLI